ncbi:MAG: lipase maturation factor family protein [Chlamydiales bacterium]|nr:lipase maturation factor family protein [Chlamydiales bacterium]
MTWQRKLADFFYSPHDSSYWLSRFIFLRFLGLVYFFAFFSLWWQFPGLLGENGILPASFYLHKLSQLPQFSSFTDAILELPSIFWLNSSDEFMLMVAKVGVIFSLLLLCGFANVFILFLLWIFYFSFIQVGQRFYSFGWDILLCETGFLALFICPLYQVNNFFKKSPPHILIIWLFRFLAFRIMLGAGLIKLNAQEECWKDLTCLDYHYETQPIPNPISWYLHQLPKDFQHFSVLVNHFIELIIPFFLIGPRKLRIFGGICTIAFQFLLILSGNLSFLNWLTITTCLFCFDDRFYCHLLSTNTKERFKLFLESFQRSRPAEAKLFTGRNFVAISFFTLSIYLAQYPIQNLLPQRGDVNFFFQNYLGTSNPTPQLFPKRQLMNSSFNKMLIMNTYGAFGTVGKSRHEIIIYGTNEDRITKDTKWLEYEFKYKPGSLIRRPPVIAPYQPRLDWQIWFAAMGQYRNYPWFITLVAKLLENESVVLDLIAHNPFPESPPKFIKADLFLYEFTSWNEESDHWWKRSKVGPYLPPISLENKSLRDFLKFRGHKVPAY